MVTGLLKSFVKKTVKAIGLTQARLFALAVSPSGISSSLDANAVTG
jgi:hypothetical protein